MLFIHINKPDDGWRCGEVDDIVIGYISILSTLWTAYPACDAPQSQATQTLLTVDMFTGKSPGVSENLQAERTGDLCCSPLLGLRLFPQ